MLYAVKTIIAVLVILISTEISKRNTVIGAIILALPFITTTAMVWIYIETKDSLRIAELADQSFFYVLATLPMFLLLSWLLKHQYNFYLALALSCGLTFGLVTLTEYCLKKFS